MRGDTRVVPMDVKFWSKVYERGEDACWPWLGVLCRGYGRIGGGKAHVWLAAHRVCYELVFGPIPLKMEVDHTCTHRWCVNPRHLRAATHSQNQMNSGAYKSNKLGAKGVNTRGNRYCAQIQVSGKKIHLGSFSNLEEARKAYSAAAEKYHGEFANTGGVAC